MKENWRVVRESSGIGEVGQLYIFRLEDVYEHPANSFYPLLSNAHPFIAHESHGLEICGDTPERLKERLKAMLEALEKPILDWGPRTLTEVAPTTVKAVK